jgi:Bacterial regulatory helix-turn-helix proteins, AraC family
VTGRSGIEKRRSPSRSERERAHSLALAGAVRRRDRDWCDRYRRAPEVSRDEDSVTSSGNRGRCSLPVGHPPLQPAPSGQANLSGRPLIAARHYKPVPCPTHELHTDLPFATTPELRAHGRGVVRRASDAVLGILRERLAAPWALSALAQVAHLSRSQLVRALDATVGMSPMAYLRQMRAAPRTDHPCGDLSGRDPRPCRPAGALSAPQVIYAWDSATPTTVTGHPRAVRRSR